MEAIAVFIGGGCGASLRYLFGLWASKFFGITYWATFFINVLGCLFLGFVFSLLMRHPDFINHKSYLFLTVGLAGGFTTFSTFGYENLILLREGKILKSIFYIILSLFLGILAIYAGYFLSGLINV